MKLSSQGRRLLYIYIKYITCLYYMFFLELIIKRRHLDANLFNSSNLSRQTIVIRGDRL